MRVFRGFFGVAFAALAALGGAACDDFLDVSDPGELTADAIDPERDGETLSRSAMQNLVDAFGQLVVNTAWFTNEARVGDSFPTRNQFGRRNVSGDNGTHNGENWEPLQLAISSAEDAIRLIGDAGGINAGRVSWVSGFGILLMAELFCEGTVKADVAEPGTRLDTNQMLDMAIERLTEAREFLASDTTAEARDLATAALVGIARAHLFAGRNDEAATTAGEVPGDFVFDFEHVDDVANRGRLANNVWNFSIARLSLVVGPEFIAMADAADPRIAYVDTERRAQDNELQFFRQDKVKDWGDPIRFASGLEAQYIIQEAQRNLADVIDFINERREVGGLEPFSSSNQDEIWTEFFNQLSRDFWLEARRMPAWRRDLEHMPFIIEPGDNYYKTGLGLVSNQTCLIVPLDEIDNNPNWET